MSDFILVRLDTLLDTLDLECDAGVVLLQLLVEEFAAPGDPLFGLEADALHLGLRPFANGDHVGLGGLAQRSGLVFLASVQLLRVRLRVCLALIDRRLPRRLGGRVHS